MRLRICMAENTNIQPHYGPGFDSASNRNEYQEYSWGVKGGRQAHQVGNLNVICESVV
jgi:hypothetical protein